MQKHKGVWKDMLNSMDLKSDSGIYNKLDAR